MQATAIGSWIMSRRLAWEQFGAEQQNKHECHNLPIQHFKLRLERVPRFILMRSAYFPAVHR